MNYIPQFLDFEMELLNFNNVHEARSCLDYADRHNFNVLFTDVSHPDSARVITMFQNKGYEYAIQKNGYYDNSGNQIYCGPVCVFTRKLNRDRFRFLEVM